MKKQSIDRAQKIATLLALSQGRLTLASLLPPPPQKIWMRLNNGYSFRCGDITKTPDEMALAQKSAKAKGYPLLFVNVVSTGVPLANRECDVVGVV